MKRLRQTASGRVTRKIAEDTVVRTIFGDTEVAQQNCIVCHKLKYKFEFYLESKSKRKFSNQTRKQCVECWDLLKGKTPTYDFYLNNEEI
jgi:hypothetical protein